MSEQKQQVPSVGRIVHFVYGGQHVPAIITDPEFRVVTDSYDAIEQAMTVFLPNAEPFTTCAKHAEADASGTYPHGSWHWPEYVPAK